jgi:hypothetical protein
MYVGIRCGVLPRVGLGDGDVMPKSRRRPLTALFLSIDSGDVAAVCVDVPVAADLFEEGVVLGLEYGRTLRSGVVRSACCVSVLCTTGGVEAMTDNQRTGLE